jgi:hypothetical protein
VPANPSLLEAVRDYLKQLDPSKQKKERGAK